MRLTKKHERLLHRELMAVLTLPNGDVCCECGFINDIKNTDNGVEYIWEKSFSYLVNQFMKPYKEMPEIDDDFKKKWIDYHDKNGVVVAICWECQYVWGGEEKN